MATTFIFDLDGVITDTADLHYQAWKALADELGIPMNRTFNEQLKGLSRMDSLDIILGESGKSDDFSSEEKEQLATQKNEHYQKLILTLGPADMLPGIPELLNTLKVSGYKLGLASASRNARTVLEALEILDVFDVIADAEKVENSKPAPDIFLLAASSLKASPQDCIGIEDAASGIEAIKRAGMVAIGVGETEILKKADLVVSTTDELNVEDMLKVWQANTPK
ncbi:Beta-phosphoglucomutase [Lentibacillus sp. JNUCC-1]|uniref:beta-phosphoglucomutase n=1 Tax=Lentibacillus sp. JNUCC-1 TaxID=2654513 RepID=UPI0012E8DABC|nr:beta-phosphoglucomutase [Lentibacillus sp. JNUCC-1]MUV36780.1 Beta-phosphoglucomutase [Lentibacillus sp. JNUCC-1]